MIDLILLYCFLRYCEGPTTKTKIDVKFFVLRSANSLHVSGTDNMALVSLHTLLSAANAPSRVPSKLANKRPGEPRPDKHHVPAKESTLTGKYFYNWYPPKA